MIVRRMIISLAAGYVVTFVVATISAIAMRSLISPLFGAYIRTDADGLAFLPMVTGYLAVAAALVWIVSRVKTSATGWLHGAMVGAVLGSAVFLGDHLITAGWSKLPALPMLISGVIDIVAVIAGGSAVGAIACRDHCREGLLS